MELLQLNSFVTVAKTGNLTRAAEVLNTTPPSVSAHIRQMENRFGLALFLRTPRGMELTPAGKVLAEKARAVLEASQQFSRAAMALSGQVTGNLRLGINANPAFLRIEPLVLSLFLNHPGLCLEVVLSNTPEILDSLVKKEMDMGYVFGEHLRPGLVFLPLARVDLDIVIPMGLKREYQNAGWERIAQLPWIRPATPCPLLDPVIQALADRKLALSNPVIANDDITKTAMINQGIAATVLERSEARQMEEQGRIFIWNGHDGLSTRISVAYLKARDGQPDMAALSSSIEAIWSRRSGQ